MQERNHRCVFIYTAEVGRYRTSRLYLNLSTTSVEGDDGSDVRLVGVSAEAADGVGGVAEAKVVLTKSEEGTPLHLHLHGGFSAGDRGCDWNRYRHVEK